MNRQLKKELKIFLALMIPFVIVCVMANNLEIDKFHSPVPYQGYIKNYDGSLIKVVEAVTITPVTPEEILPAFENKYEELAYKVFGEDDGKIAYAIAQAESSLKPDRCHIDEKEYSCGLMQINLRAHQAKVPGDTFEEKAEWLKDPENNFVMARVIKASSGWRAWTMFTNKHYLNFYED